VHTRVTYEYDARGNRIQQPLDLTGSATSIAVTNFPYDHNRNAWADLDGNNSNSLLVRRIYANAMDALLARIDSNGVAWYLTDDLGSVRDITNASGTLIDHRDYAVFGTLTTETYPTRGDRYGYTSREFDS